MSQNILDEELPDTQPSLSPLSQLTPHDDESWGILHPLSSSISSSSILLKNDKFSAGREYDNDYVFSEKNVRRTAIKTSKKHFKIERVVEKHGKASFAFIVDLSSNGTYVGGQKIGKNKRRILSHGDAIAIVSPINEIFAYWSTQDVFKVPGIPTEINKNYVIFSKLGKGGFGDVYLSLKKSTCQEMAMKMIDNADRLAEPDIMYRINHPNVVKIFDTLMVDQKLFFFMEYMPGGNLEDFIKSKVHLNESVTKYISYQLIKGVDELHRLKIIHRDIKPMNILLSAADEYPIVKLTDFGLSKIMKKNTTDAHTMCGTQCYAPPELVQVKRGEVIHNYDGRCDIWSIGIVTYKCLCGTVPFKDGPMKLPVLEQIKQAAVSFQPIELWKNVSIESKFLIRSMLAKLYYRRPNTTELLRQSWFLNDTDLMERVGEKENASDIPSKRIRIS